VKFEIQLKLISPKTSRFPRPGGSKELALGLYKAEKEIKLLNV
jgi:hypothetical protein